MAVLVQDNAHEQYRDEYDTPDRFRGASLQPIDCANPGKQEEEAGVDADGGAA
jgi:hypothetical protein